MSIPEARARLLELANCMDRNGANDAARTIRTIVTEEMFRRYREERAPNQSRSVTCTLRDAVKAEHATHPHRPLHQIAAGRGINPGRVSEILAGVYDDLGGPAQ